MPISSELDLTDVRRAALLLLARLVREYERNATGGKPTSLMEAQSVEDVAQEIRNCVNRLREFHPPTRTELRDADVNGLVQQILDARNVRRAWQCLEKVHELQQQRGICASPDDAIHETFTSSVGDGEIRLATEMSELDDALSVALKKDLDRSTFLAAVMQMCAQYRQRQIVTYSPNDELALEHAYKLLDHGARLPQNARWIVTASPPERSHQTYLSFADPGEGHLAVTVRDNVLLDGLLVHIEYIDRDNIDQTSVVEAYRLPSIRNAARIRLHVGSATACTAFIGRPVFESGSFELGLLKAAHAWASVCSAMFAQGIADCKIAMDSLTASQAVKLMRAVAGNVVRDRRQRLSAAFNINSPLMDDRAERRQPREVRSRVELAGIAIELTKEGRFDKVAWDGASNETPSRPIVGQLKRCELLDVVHRAHEHGLETYISAGMEPAHMRDAVLVGVGGVGIGTALHQKIGPGGSIVGPVNRDKVRSALGIRNNAARETAGQAAQLLAVLDWQFAEQSLLDELDPFRKELYETLRGFLAALDSNSPPQRSQDLLATVFQRVQDRVKRLAGKKRRPVDDDLAHPISATGGKSAGRYPTDRLELPANPVLARGLRVLRAHRTGTIAGAERLRKASLEQLEALIVAGDAEGVERLMTDHLVLVAPSSPREGGPPEQ